MLAGTSSPDYPKGLLAESARAVTGRQCPYSAVGRGETFWRVDWVSFYENGHNSGMKSPKIDIKVGNEPSLRGLQTGR